MSANQRTIAATLNAAAVRGMYYDKLPPKEPTLLELAEHAIIARALFNAADVDGIGDWSAANSADYEASRAFNDALCDQTGIPPHVWRKLAGRIMP